MWETALSIDTNIILKNDACLESIRPICDKNSND